MNVSTTNTTVASELRRGWTTGACATAATKAALTALLSGQFPDPVMITLPKGQKPQFALALEGIGENWAKAGIIKDAGDDPDVTHGCLVVSTVKLVHEQGVRFRAGQGVGTVTKAGLPLKVGEPAINPVPREMMMNIVAPLLEEYGDMLGGYQGVEIEISIPGGADLALKTWNPRLGIVGGLSVLGTTGIVNPFSCSAWIASIHRGIDVALAQGIDHLAGATGSTSEKAVQELYGLQDQALIDMGDFVGGMLKYLRDKTLNRVSIAGGFAKITKLAQGAMDLHSGRSQVDFDFLAREAKSLGADRALCLKIQKANTALEVAGLAKKNSINIADNIAEKAACQARKILRQTTAKADIVIVDRSGKVVARAQE